MIDNSPRPDGCDFRLNRDDDGLVNLARDEEREERGECSRLGPNSREVGSTLTDELGGSGA